MSDFKSRYEAITKEQHDALAAKRGRPLTDGPIQLRHRVEVVAPEIEGPSLLERLLGGMRRGRRD